MLCVKVNDVAPRDRLATVRLAALVTRWSVKACVLQKFHFILAPYCFCTTVVTRLHVYWLLVSVCTFSQLALVAVAGAPPPPALNTVDF